MTATAVKHGKTKAFEGQNNSYAREFLLFVSREIYIIGEYPQYAFTHGIGAYG